jgi:hypothetical protein
MPNLEFTIFTYASALRPPLLLEANASTATGGATHSKQWWEVHACVRKESLHCDSGLDV